MHLRFTTGFPRGLAAAWANLCLFIILGASPASSQGSIPVLTENFADDSQFTKVDGNGNPLSFYSDGADSYFGIVDGIALLNDFDGDPVPTGVLTFIDSLESRYLVSEDADGPGTDLPVSLLWTDLEVGSFTDLNIRGFLAATQDQTFEAGDFVAVEVSFDDGPFTSVLEFRAGVDNRLREDLDFDGVGEGETLDLRFGRFETQVAVAGASLDVRLSIASDGSSEEIAVDTLLVLGQRVNQWNVAGPASFFVPNHWSLATVPVATDIVFIGNGGSAVADGSEVANPSSQQVDSLLLGDRLGSGSLEMSRVDLRVEESLDVGAEYRPPLATSGTFENLSGSLIFKDASFLTAEDFSVGQFVARGTATITGSASLELENVGLIDIDEQINIMDAVPIEQASVAGTATVSMRNVGTLRTGSDLDICDANPSPSGNGTATAQCTVDSVIEDVTLIDVGDDIQIADGIALAAGSSTQDVEAEFRDIQRLEVAENLEVSTGSDVDGLGGRAAVNDIVAEVIFERVSLIVGEGFLINEFSVFEEGGVNSTVTVELLSSSVTTADGSEGEIGRLNGNGGQAENRLETTFRMVDSTFFHGGEMNVGRRSGSALGTVETLIELDEGSKITAEVFELGGAGTLRLHLDGITSTLNDPALGQTEAAKFSSLEVEEATFLGDIVAVFDFVPEAGSYTFDLVKSTIDIADDGATFTVEGLDPGFTVDFFGLTNDSEDVIRLMISGAPAEADLAVSLDNGTASVVAGTEITYTLVASNQGPSDEPEAVLTDIFPDDLFCSWTSVASGGASGGSNDSGDSLEDILNLPNGSSMTYTMICDLGRVNANCSESLSDQSAVNKGHIHQIEFLETRENPPESFQAAK